MSSELDKKMAEYDARVQSKTFRGQRQQVVYVDQQVVRDQTDRVGDMLMRAHNERKAAVRRHLMDVKIVRDNRPKVEEERPTYTNKKGVVSTEIPSLKASQIILGKSFKGLERIAAQKLIDDFKAQGM